MSVQVEYPFRLAGGNLQLREDEFRLFAEA